MIFNIFQINLDDMDQIAMSCGGDTDRSKVYRAVSWKGSDNYHPAMFDAYSRVAWCDVADLNAVFRVGNIGPDDGERLERVADRMHSVSVGDIIGDTNGKFYMVDPIGFTEVKIQ